MSILAWLLPWGAGLAACSLNPNNQPGDGGSKGGSVGTSSTGGRGGSSGTTGTPTSTSTTTSGAGGVDASSDAGPAPLCTGTMPPPSNSTDGAANGDYVIADFSTMASAAFGGYGSPIFGGTYQFSNGSQALKEDFSAANWHVTGTVDNLAGFGLWWGCASSGTYVGCTLDASTYRGIQFTVKGDAGPSGKLALSLGRVDNDPVTPGKCGSCTAATCTGPAATFDVVPGGAPHTVFLRWEDFTGGKPHDVADPHGITGILWLFEPPALPQLDGGVGDAAADASGDGAAEGGTGGHGNGGPPYPGDITIGDIRFVAY
jgi:hypothetical protein